MGFAAFALLLVLSLSSRPAQAQYAQADGLSARRALSGAILGTGVGVAAGLTIDVFRANILEDYWEGEPSLANIVAHYSPWFAVGGVAGLVGIGLREEASQSARTPSPWRWLDMSGCGRCRPRGSRLWEAARPAC